MVADSEVDHSTAADTFTFTGADPGEGLDFSGDIVYAVDIRGPGGVTIGDAHFTDDSTTVGVTVTAEDEILAWGDAIEFGDSGADDALESLMHSIRFSSQPNPITVTLANLEAGTEYRLQLLFHEQCCERGFDVFIGGQLVVDEYSPQRDQGGLRSGGRPGAAINYDFVAGDAGALTVTLDGSGSTFPDTNPILNALTLERNPGSSTPAEVDLSTAATLSRGACGYSANVQDSEWGACFDEGTACQADAACLSLISNGEPDEAVCMANELCALLWECTMSGGGGGAGEAGLLVVQDGESFGISHGIHDGWHNVNCHWALQCPAGSVTTVSFSWFDTEGGWDFVNLFSAEHEQAASRLTGDAGSTGDLAHFSGSLFELGGLGAVEGATLVQYITDGGTLTDPSGFSATLTCVQRLDWEVGTGAQWCSGWRHADCDVRALSRALDTLMREEPVDPRAYETFSVRASADGAQEQLSSGAVVVGSAEYTLGHDGTDAQLVGIGAPHAHLLPCHSFSHTNLKSPCAEQYSRTSVSRAPLM